jgi:hypothetical protein
VAISPCYSLVTGRNERARPANALNPVEKNDLFSIASEETFMWGESKDREE